MRLQLTALAVLVCVAPAGAATSSRGCLTGETRAVLSGLEARFGPQKVISTCRPGAVIAGSGRPSQHRYGKAVDFMPRGNRAGILAYLRSRARGAVITYSTGHIHFDTGGYRYYGHNGGGKRYARAARNAQPGTILGFMHNLSQ